MSTVKFAPVLLLLSVAPFFSAAAFEIEPVIPEKSAPQVTDEKGAALYKRPVLFSLFLGSRLALPDAQSFEGAQAFSDTHILRKNEVIYRATGPQLTEAGPGLAAEPALRLEWDIPFERIFSSNTESAFSAQFSLEAGFSLPRTLASAAGDFRYLNNQANAPQLTDVVYAGSLTVGEKRQHLTPMVGVGFEFTNQAMQKMGALRLLVRGAMGVSLQNGWRNYELSLAPQYISAGLWSDTYTIKSTATQSYTMAILPAGRLELGGRMRIASRLHLALVASLTVLYGGLPFDNIGSFSEEGATNKTMFQKVISGIADENYGMIIPAVFLALSLEI